VARPWVKMFHGDRKARICYGVHLPGGYSHRGKNSPSRYYRSKKKANRDFLNCPADTVFTKHKVFRSLDKMRLGWRESRRFTIRIKETYRPYEEEEI
jgi:hypothetical protein